MMETKMITALSIGSSHINLGRGTRAQISKAMIKMKRKKKVRMEIKKKNRSLFETVILLKKF